MGDLRTYLQELEELGHLVRVSRAVRTRGELAAVQWNVEKQLFKAVLFEKVEGYAGEVAGNLFLVPLRMGITPTVPMMPEILSIYQGIKKPGIVYPVWATNTMFMDIYNEIERIIVKALNNGLTPGECKAHDLIYTFIDNKIDVFHQIPAPWYFREDAGHYLTTAVTIAKHPETGYVNAGIYRIQLIGGDRLAIMVNVKRDLLSLITAATRANRKLEVAVAIGVSCELLVAATISVPYGVSEYDIAGGLAGQPYKVLSGATVDLPLPADAEYVIEGFIDPTERVAEGPFTEYDLLASQVTNSFMIHVTAVRHKESPIFHSLVCTSLEMVSLILPLGITEMRKASTFLKEITSNIKAIWMLPGVPGVGLVVSIYKQHEAEPLEIIRAMFAFSARFKRIVIVDDDIDIYDPIDVQWAIDTRVVNLRDIVVLEATGELTDAARVGDFSVKMGIDATRKRQHPCKVERSDLAQFADVNLKDYLEG